MIDDVFDLRRAAESGFPAIGQHFFEEVTVIFFLRRRINQAGISRRILRLELSDAFEVSGIGDHCGELLDLFELVQICVRAHKKFVTGRVSYVGLFMPEAALSSSPG